MYNDDWNGGLHDKFKIAILVETYGLKDQGYAIINYHFVVRLQFLFNDHDDPYT